MPLIQNLFMKYSLTLTFFLFALLRISLTVDCPASHFTFQSAYNLGKQDELNCTFDKIAEKITFLSNVTFQVNETLSYTIFNTKPTFRYIDSKQKSEIVKNNTIVISGGVVDVILNFNWTKKDSLPMSGYGTAIARSESIDFVKNISIETGFYFYGLLDSEPVEFVEQFPLTRISPPDTKQADIDNLKRLLNNILKVRTIKVELEDEVDKYYAYYLRNCLHDEHQPIDNYFDYVWKPNGGKPNVTIQFKRRPVSVEIDPTGINFYMELQVINSTNWTCGDRNAPDVAMNQKLYGGSQSFISFNFYENVLKYAVSKNIIDTDLNRENWESRMFQFYAGDLYDMFPGVAAKYLASAEVMGNCRANYQNLGVKKAGYETFNATITYDCEISIEKQKIIDFSVFLELEIDGIALENSLNFKLLSFTSTPKFFPYGGFAFKNEGLAREMIQHSLNRLHEGYLFGSNWPLSPSRDYPHFITEDNFTLIFDSTHVPPHSAELIM